MEYGFPFPVRIQSQVPQLEGLRLSPFTNLDGEQHPRPTLNGRWRINMAVVARGEGAQLALAAFYDAMSQGGATCVVPVCTQFRPNNHDGRMLTGCDMAPEYTFEHVGFLGEPFDGFTLRVAANHRDSYIDVNMPLLSKIRAGHLISLGERLHRVINVNFISESETAARLSLIPNVRGSYPAGEIVIVDQLRIKCQMLEGDPIGFGIDRIKLSSLSFVESF